MIQFSIPGKPIPQERRVHIRGGWAFDPAKSRKAKKVVRDYAMAEITPFDKNHFPSEYSFIVDLQFLGPHWGADWDNLAKLAVDSMTGVFWKDDHQIVEAHVRKVRVPKGQEKTIVKIEELRPEAL